MNRLRKFLGPILVPDLKRTRRHLAASVLVIALLLFTKGWAEPRLDAWLYPPDNIRLNMALAIERTGLADVTYIRETDAALTFYMAVQADNTAEFGRLFGAWYEQVSTYLVGKLASPRSIDIIFVTRHRQLGHYIYLYAADMVQCPRSVVGLTVEVARTECKVLRTPLGGVPAASADLGWADGR